MQKDLICGSQFAFGACRFAGGTFPKCAASEMMYYACEYHDKGQVRFWLAQMQYDAHVQEYHFRRRVGLMVLQPQLKIKLAEV